MKCLCLAGVVILHVSLDVTGFIIDVVDKSTLQLIT